MSGRDTPNGIGRRAALARLLGPTVWIVVGQGYAKLMSFAAYFLMVRHLAPEDVGLVALCWLWVAVGDTFFDAGLGQAYVRDGVRDARAESTLFWALLGLAVLWTAAALGVGPLLARAFDEPEIVPAMAALSLIFPLKALGWTQLSVQIVERRVMSITARDVIAATVASALGVALAWAGAGWWALVARLVCLPAVGSLLIALVARWRPRAEFDRAWLGEKLRFGVPLTAASNAHWLVVLQIEGYLVGHALGLGALGLVQFAKKPTEVLSQVMVAIQSVHLLRELSAARDSPPLWRAILRRELALYGAFGTLVGLAGLGFAFLVVGPVWGERWSAAVPLLAVLSLAAPPIAMQAVAATALVARGDLRALLRTNLVGAALTCALLAFGVDHGVVGVAVAQTLAFAIVALMTLAALRGWGPTASGGVPTDRSAGTAPRGRPRGRSARRRTRA